MQKAEKVVLQVGKTNHMAADLKQDPFWWIQRAEPGQRDEHQRDAGPHCGEPWGSSSGGRHPQAVCLGSAGWAWEAICQEFLQGLKWGS